MTRQPRSRAARRLDPSRVPVEPFAAAVQRRMLEDDWSWNRLAVATYGHRPGKPHYQGDTTRLKRALGLADYGHDARGYTSRARSIHYACALRIARAVGLDPVEVGL